MRLVIQTLEKQGWQYKTDSGWSDFDIEIFASRWGHLYLTSVVEPYANEQVLLRCRMKTAWSLFAKLSFWTVAGLELLVIGVFRDNSPVALAIASDASALRLVYRLGSSQPATRHCYPSRRSRRALWREEISADQSLPRRLIRSAVQNADRQRGASRKFLPSTLLLR